MTGKQLLKVVQPAFGVLNGEIGTLNILFNAIKHLKYHID